MKRIPQSILACAIGLVFCTAASAQPLSKDEWHTAKNQVSADYKTAMVACSTFAGNAHDICKAEAKGKEAVALADLKQRYEPSRDHRHAARMARADADLSVARQRCDESSGNSKDVCVKEAKARHVSAKADADTARTVGEANSEARTTAGAATLKANATANEARKDASVEKLDAALAVAKEKCDAFAGEAHTRCVDEANAKRGK